MRTHLYRMMLSILSLIALPVYGGKDEKQLPAVADSSLDREIAKAGESDTAIAHPEFNGIRVEQEFIGGIYLMMGGNLRPVPNPATYNNLFIDWSGIHNVLLLDPFTIGAPLDDGASLIRRGTGEIYLVTDGKKYHIPSPAVLRRYYFDAGKAILVPDNVANAIPTGPDL